MKRQGVVLAFVVLVCAFLPSATQASKAHAPANSPACGAITTSTTWSGQITLTCNVTVGQGVTLTIMPDTLITGNAIVTVLGALQANGQFAHAINFSGGASLAFGATATASTITYLSVQGASTGLSGVVPPGGLTISSSTFSGDGTGIAMDAGSGTFHGTNLDVSNNSVDGMSFTDVQFASQISVKTSNIVNNGAWNLELSGNASASIEASNDWWGSSSLTTARAKIHDHSQDSSRPYAIVDPIATSAITTAGVGVSSSGPTPTATTIPTSTATPLATVPTSTPTATATATPIPPAAILINPDRVRAGVDTLITVSGSGFSAGETVTISYMATVTNGSTQAETTSAIADNSGGFFTGGLPSPATVQPAQYVITATGATSGRHATAVLTVQANSAVPTITPSPITVPTSTSTPIPTPTNTPLPTSTPVPTATRVPVRKLSVVGVHILHLVRGKEVNTQRLKVGEFAEFVVQYSAPSGAHVTATLNITRNGKSLGSVLLAPLTYAGHSAYGWIIGFTQTAGLGKFYAHFHLSATGGLTAKRDRKFFVSRK